MKRFIRVFLLALALVLALPGLALAKNYRIGVLVPLTGPKAEKGVPIKQAAELFVERLNAAGGINGDKFELVVKDDFDDPEKAKAAASELVNDPALLGVVCHYYPGTALATAKIFDDAKIPCISPNVSTPALFKSNKWLFSANMTDDVQGAFMAVYIKEVLKKDNVLVVYSTDPFGSSLRDAFIAKAARIGLTVQKQLPVDAKVPAEWAAQNLQDAEENGKIGIVAGLTHSEQGLVFLPQLRKAGIKTPVMAANSWTNPKFFSELDDKVTANVYVTSALLWEIANQNASEFKQAYQKKFRDQPSLAAAMTYDAMGLFAGAVTAAKGEATRDGVRNYLVNLGWHDAFDGASGNLFFKRQTEMTQSYVARYQQVLAEEAAAAALANGEKVAPAAAVEAPAPAAPELGESHAPDRDIYVSVMKDGRFKTAPVQLLLPREEYVFKELAERVRKGYVTVIDGMPYHLVDVISVGVDIIKINDINIKDMLWDVDVFMWFKWVGGRLDVKDIEKIGVINAVKEQMSILKESLGGSTKYRAYRKRLTLSAPFQLEAFPFDSQVLPMSIAHTSKNSTHVMLVWDSRHMESTPVKDIKPQEWTYVDRTTYSDLYRYESTFGDPDYRLGTGYKSPIYFSTVNLDVSVERIIKPYLFTFFLPLLIILGIILLVLWVPIDQFAPRINASISGLVGILVYHMSQKNSFPKVGYTMVADYYFLVAYAFVVIMIISIIVTQNMVSNGQKDQAKVWNKRLTLGALAAAVSVYAALTLLAIYAY